LETHEEETHFQDADLIEVAKNVELQKDIKNYKSLRIGELFLDKYRIVKVLGRGNSSIIYLLVSNDESQKLFVLKEFFPKGFVERNDKEEITVKDSLTKAELKNYHLMQEIFVGEAQNLMRVSSIKHPNVVHFLTFEKNINNTSYYMMEYEEGHTLKTYIENIKKPGLVNKLENKEITSLAIALLSGIKHIHDAGVYHQDIKLENILMRKDSSPIIVDFGASVLVHDKENKKYYNTATLKYAAPEQITMDNPPKINETTDIYNLGVLLYNLITGTFPPKADERIKSLENGKDVYAPLMEQGLADYDKNLLKAVDKSLNLVQNERFQNATEFKEALLKSSLKKSFIAALLVPLFFALIYFAWPSSQSNVVIAKPEVKIEKSAILDVASASNIKTIKTHEVTIQSDIIEVKYLLNGKKLNNNKFLAKEGQSYTILSMAEGYEPQEYKINYEALSKNAFILNNHMLDNREQELETGMDLSAYSDEEEVDIIDDPIEEDEEIAPPLQVPLEEESSFGMIPSLDVESEEPVFRTSEIKVVKKPIIVKESEAKNEDIAEKARVQENLRKKRALEREQVAKKIKANTQRKAEEKKREAKRKATEKRRFAEKKRVAKRKKIIVKKRKIAKRKNVKKRQNVKKRKVKKSNMASGSVWYCVARTGAILRSVKKHRKSTARSTALWSCKKASRGQSICKVSCYLWK